ncbi:MAG: hypothetical protein BM485_02590 [Desulfobulbaceae bacterium DB1]|nr:MAG: hypothetical protein BM485_02590 [Desulfobulbaceae bacterium DB1]
MKVVFLGDSLVQFYDWQQCFPGISVVNRGIAGETVGGLRQRMDHELDRFAADAHVVMLMIGANNVVMQDYGFMPDYQAILGKVREKNPTCRPVVTSLFPFRLPRLAPDGVLRLNRLLRKAAGEWQADYLDIHEHFVAVESRGNSCFVADGVHLCETGYRVWTEEIRHYLRRLSDG